MRQCQDCNLLQKAMPKHRCYFCQLRKDGTDVEAHAAFERQSAERMSFDSQMRVAGIDPDLITLCGDCRHLIPNFYMKTKKRCRGCQIVLDREKRDAKKYGLVAGERQEWYVAQDGKCFGCGKKQIVTGLAVHHSHLTGEPFYLACLTCNHGVMGMAMDNPMTLIRLGLGMLIPPHQKGGVDAINRILGMIKSSPEKEE